mgnify:FL=1
MSKQKVFDLAKQHGHNVEYSIDRELYDDWVMYYNCTITCKEGETFDGYDNPCITIDCSSDDGEGYPQNAKEFWAAMLEDYQEGLDIIKKEKEQKNK